MAVRASIRDNARTHVRCNVRDPRIRGVGGILPEGFCILVDDIGDQLTDDNGDILVAPCT